MRDTLALRLQPRIARLATEDVIEIVDQIAGQQKSGVKSSLLTNSQI